MLKSFVFIIVLLALCSCKERQKTPFCITYRATGNFLEFEGMQISYRDSNTYVTVYTTDRHWTKDVCLPADEFASLFVTPQTAPCVNHEKKIGKYASLREARMAVRGEIIYKNKVISKRSSEIVSVSLFPLEL